MLRGRCSCAISVRPGTSSAPRIQLTPLFPLHPGKSPVSAFFPLLTQKPGGGGYPKEVREAKEVEEVKELDYKRAFLTPAFTTTSIAIVGAPTFSLLHAIGRSQERPASLLRRASRGDPYTNFELSTFNLEPPLSFFRLFLNLKLTTDHLKLHNPNHSRTYAREARKSNHSRTYAKTGGWGPSNQMASPITLLFSSAMLTCKLSVIVGAPTFSFRPRRLPQGDERSLQGLKPNSLCRLYVRAEALTS
jgi:hypothetical protein